MDLVFQGHDHNYGRGHKVDSKLGQWNEDLGIVFVVSVSGRKMYEMGDEPWMQKEAENQQFFK